MQKGILNHSISKPPYMESESLCPNNLADICLYF